MQESTMVITKKIGDIWSFAGEDERKGRHKNSEGRDCHGRSFRGNSLEAGASYSGTVQCLTCRRVVPGWEHGLTEDENGAIAPASLGKPGLPGVEVG
jgi:hypothetical protein